MKSATYIDWCHNEEADLKRLWGEGKSAAEIMRTLNANYRRARSRSAVIGKAHRLGLDARRTPSRPVPIRLAAERTLSEKRRNAGEAGAIKTRRAGKPAPASFRFGANPTEPTPERAAGLGKDRIRNPRLLPGQTPEGGKTITEMGARECRYALTADAPHRFCGRPTTHGKSYCPAHLKGLCQAGPAPGNPHARETEKDQGQ